MVKEISKSGNYEVIVLDNLSKGHKEAIGSDITLEVGDIRNKGDLERVFTAHHPDAVFHFSASIEVAESCQDPLKYYENNVAGTITLLQTMQKYKTKVFLDLTSFSYSPLLLLCLECLKECLFTLKIRLCQ